MGTSIKESLVNISFLLGRQNPFLRMAWLVFPAILVFLYYFSKNLFPLSDATSIQAGLTLLAEILGVLLGAVLVIVVLFIEQHRQSDDLLAQSFSEYRSLIKKNLPLIIKARKHLVRVIPKTIEEFSDQDSRVTKAFMFGYKKCAMALSAISLAFDAENYKIILADIEKIESLDSLNGIPEEYQDVESVSTDLTIESQTFFRILLDGLDYMELDNWGASKDVLSFAEVVHDDLLRRGVESALNRNDYSIAFLKSRLLSSTIAVITVTLFVSVFTIFGVAPETYHNPWVIIPVNFAILGFLISVFLLYFSVGKLLAIGQEMKP